MLNPKTVVQIISDNGPILKSHFCEKNVLFLMKKCTLAKTQNTFDGKQNYHFGALLDLDEGIVDGLKIGPNCILIGVCVKKPQF
jgi:hypothetical protein